MKELLSLAFTVLFIACQDHSLAEIKLQTESEIQASASVAPVALSLSALPDWTSPSCELNTKESLDIQRELEHPHNPGIHFRQAALKSEVGDRNPAQLECAARVTENLNDEPTNFQIAENPTSKRSPASDENTEVSWEFLTEKFTWMEEKRSCDLYDSASENPFCHVEMVYPSQGILITAQSL